MKIAERIADALKLDIVEGRLEPGDALPSERDLAGHYEVNRSSVREALHRLEAWGLVEIRHGGGARVRDFLLNAGLEVLPHLFQLGRKLDPAVQRDLHEIRGMLLGWCAAQAAHKADAASVERLDRLARRMAEPKLKPAELQDLDYEFFLELVGITGNRLLGVFAGAVRELYLRRREVFAGLYAKDVFDPALHRAAARAIRKRDPEAARRAMQAHAETALRTVEAAR